MKIEYDVYHDEDGNLQMDPMCPWCNSTRGFYKKRVDTHYGRGTTYHNRVTYCLDCGADVKREGDGFTRDL